MTWQCHPTARRRSLDRRTTRLCCSTLKMDKSSRPLTVRPRNAKKRGGKQKERGNQARVLFQTANAANVLIHTHTLILIHTHTLSLSHTISLYVLQITVTASLPWSFHVTARISLSAALTATSRTLCVCVCVCVYMCACVHVCMCACVHVCMGMSRVVFVLCLRVLSCS